MKRVEAEHTAKLLNAAGWPAGVAVRADVCGDGQYVTVRMAVPGLTPVRWKLRRPVGRIAIRELWDKAERMLWDDGRRDSLWLAETLWRVGRLTKASPVAKRVAVLAAIAIEADGLPVPTVLDWRHISVILRWEHRGTELEVGCDLNGNLSVCLNVPGRHMLIDSWPCLHLPRGTSCVAYDRARTAVYGLFGKQAAGTAGVIW